MIELEKENLGQHIGKINDSLDITRQSFYASVYPLVTDGRKIFLES
jgi:hypothetical protein